MYFASGDPEAFLLLRWKLSFIIRLPIFTILFFSLPISVSIAFAMDNISFGIWDTSKI
jgi:hypothetical protein